MTAQQLSLEYEFYIKVHITTRERAYWIESHFYILIIVDAKIQLDHVRALHSRLYWYTIGLRYAVRLNVFADLTRVIKSTGI